MRPAILFSVVMLALAATGCRTTDDKFNEHEAALNKALVDTYSDGAINNAIIAQHTIFPYHFETNSATLNELGRHDVRVLAEYYLQYTGPVNVTRGNASNALYRARMDAVNEALVEEGIPEGRVAILSDLPGGEGIKSERAVTILTKPNATLSTPYGVDGGLAISVGSVMSEAGPVTTGGQQ